MKIFLVLLLFLCGCSSLGTHNIELLEKMHKEGRFGVMQNVNLCVYLDSGVYHPQEVQNLIDEAWNNAEAVRVNLRFHVQHIRPWRRDSFTYDGIVGDIKKIRLEDDCDRVFVLVGRHLGDVLYGLASFYLPLPEVLGATVATHAYAVSGFATVNQLFVSKTHTINHELYHLLGCDHDEMDQCYERIAKLKLAKANDAFFPALFYIDRSSVENNPGSPFILKDREEVYYVMNKKIESIGRPKYTDKELSDLTVSKSKILQSIAKSDDSCEQTYYINVGEAPKDLLGINNIKCGGKSIGTSYIYDDFREEYYQSI